MINIISNLNTFQVEYLKVQGLPSNSFQYQYQKKKSFEMKAAAL